MSPKKLNTQVVINELKGQSAFFKSPPSAVPLSDKQPRIPPSRDTPNKSQTCEVTDLQSNRVTESVSNRLTDFDDYDVPDYRKLRRVELRLTWEQNEFLDGLEAVISRGMPEGQRSNPNYKRITKNSIIRTLVEIARRLELDVDAKNFKNERDLARAISEALSTKLTESVTNRVTE